MMKSEIVLFWIKISFLLLLIVLMILWIILAIETDNQINEINRKINRNRFDDRKFSLHQALPSINYRATISRLYSITIINCLIEESIAIGLIVVCFWTKAKNCFPTLNGLFSLLWLIKQFQLSDLFHQIDSNEWLNFDLFLTTHIIHFLVIFVAFIITIFFVQSRILDPIEIHNSIGFNDTQRFGSRILKLNDLETKKSLKMMINPMIINNNNNNDDDNDDHLHHFHQNQQSQQQQHQRSTNTNLNHSISIIPLQKHSTNWTDRKIFVQRNLSQSSPIKLGGFNKLRNQTKVSSLDLEEFPPPHPPQPPPPTPSSLVQS
ncbi:hypothetical protein SSS_02314 [Sarcoptes scabiei]|nr:hypothetical protein SSS_02314 [Sarcoptes scabiei]